ncbi:MAG: dTMP kinase [Rhodospirillales bacterium]|nr:dTMP kinase [Rhodospirillales bacterium]MBT5077241.1 dTMP kinase [Rhodospirillales bacterium]MBT5112795.1 dTMP kinase [Rhodospirillales bacterium]MBT5673565.1 dTMP kinase [Rhodospirillales bacterium]MBT6186224.1 dTMP kinase [Rhodospirillales bacterium]
MGNGKFITLEGGEGSGKSTQVGLLARFLESRDITVTLTREPGGSDGAEQIRSLLVEGEPGRWSPLSEAMLHSAARADHVERLIAPALARGDWVICDRFIDSTMAYQGFGHGLDFKTIEALNEYSCGTIRPDITLILDLAVEDGLARAKSRQHNDTEDRYERMEIDFHRRLRDGYLEIAKSNPDRCVIIDATKDVEAVSEAIQQAILAKGL